MSLEFEHAPTCRGIRCTDQLTSHTDAERGLCPCCQEEERERIAEGQLIKAMIHEIADTDFIQLDGDEYREMVFNHVYGSGDDVSLEDMIDDLESRNIDSTKFIKEFKNVQKKKKN